MAISLIKIGNSTNIPTHHYFCDEVSDKDGLDVTRVPMGSTCYVIDTSREYVLNSNKEWKEKIAQSVYGTSGQTVLDANQWVNNVYNINITQLGNYDAIFLTPSALADKTALESANIIISTNGSTVTFSAETTPIVDISLEYFISRGRANE